MSRLSNCSKLGLNAPLLKNKSQLGTPMSTSDLEERLVGFAPHFAKASWPILLLATTLTVALLGNILIQSPSFHTDLTDFAPDSSEQKAHDRISKHFQNESRPLFVHVTSDDGSNVLTLSNLKLQAEHLKVVENRSHQLQDVVVTWITAPGMVQLALDEQAQGTELASINDWPELLDLVTDDGQDCLSDPDDQLDAAATFAAASLLNQDFDISSTCDWLESGSGDGIPYSSSTLWILSIDPSLSSDERKAKQQQLRDVFDDLSSDSGLNYGVASLDLISSDIDEGTFDNLALLILLAMILVVTLLAISFRSIRGVIFPLTGLSFALIWTYGLLVLAGSKLTALEVAVAPLVLGLGIDYSIHLQRRYSVLRSEHETPAEAWLASCARLSVPLSLAVITTVAAFLANMVSPLPPLKTFGFALAFGVVMAFFNSTIVVGALHVVMDRKKDSTSTNEVVQLPVLTEPLFRIQRHQQAAVVIAALILTGASIIGALNIETDFDLADFLDDDMTIMQVRSELENSYESAGWKIVYVMFEPVSGQDSIAGDNDLLRQLSGLHSDLESNRDVVGSNRESPSYEGPYVVLRDAILRDSTFGTSHNLAVERGEVYRIDSQQEIDIAQAFSSLANNSSTADPLTGQTWSERVNNSVHLEDGKIIHMRMEVRVAASTSVESSRVVTDFDSMLGSIDEPGTIRAMLSDHATLYVTGDLVILQTVLDGLNTSQLESTLISLGVSTIVLLLLTRRLLPALIVLLPVVLATLWVVGSMAYLGLKWNVLTVMVTALTIGIGIDYAIHMWRRFEVEMERQESRWEAMRTTLSTTGVALILSAGTTAIGFLVLLLSPMPVIRDFGLVTTMTVVYSLILCVVLLPVLLLLASERGSASHNDN